MQAVTMRKLFESGVHFGHLTRFRNPKMSEYIYGVKNKVNIINLEKTLPLFKDALKAVKKVASQNGRIMFVGTKQSARSIIASVAAECGMPYVNYRWLGGMLTNYKTIKKSIRRLSDLEKMYQDESLVNLTKKERLTLRREYEKLERSLGGIKDMTGLPDMLFVVDVGYEKIAIKEANCIGIPVVGIVDTNSSPDGVTYPIPGNDDSMRSIQLYANSVAETILAAKADQQSSMTQGVDVEEFVEVDAVDSDNTAGKQA